MALPLRGTPRSGKGCTGDKHTNDTPSLLYAGQLRLTWRLYAESPQSGEISLKNETSHTVTGDLGAPSLNRAKYLCPHIDMQLRSR